MSYLFFFIFAFFLSFIITYFVRKIALRLRIIDRPPSPKSFGITRQEDLERKIHKKPTPLLGGLAVFISYLLSLFLLIFFFKDKIFGDFITLQKILFIFLGGLFLVIGGYLDDRYNLKPRYQIIWAILAALVISLADIGISHIRNPFGGIIRFDLWQIEIPVLARLTFPQDLFTFLWLLVMMYTTKLLDGLDGLVAGITGIGSLIICFVALLPFVHQYDTAYLAIGLAGVFFGFLIWNFHPAKIFLGESGSLLAGYFLGILAIISGSKIATALLIMGVPILDVIWVILRRVFFEKKSFALADKKHLHFRLLDAGLSHRGTVLLLYALTAIFGLTTLFFQTQQKFIILILVVITMVGLGVWVTRKVKPS